MLVPCPGADPYETWIRDPLPKNTFRRSATSQQMQTGRKLIAGLPLQPALSKDAKTVPSWARGGIRNKVNFARVLTYDHGDVTNSRSLKSMADDLLRHILMERIGEPDSRPLFFICHSIGGLVVKLALTHANRNARYRSIVEACYGVTFFATPHRGSSYLSNKDYSIRIRELLGLSEALTPRLMDELRLGQTALLKIDDDFKHLSSELHVWTFYETEDSNLSGVGGDAGPSNIPFKVPITSMRSAILALRHEKVYALRSNHANCPSFGMKNEQTMWMYLLDLSRAITTAKSTSQDHPHVPLRLEQQVHVEVHGFYQNDSIQGSPSSEIPNLRLFSTEGNSLESFWVEGPDGLLERRLSSTQFESEKYPEDDQFVLRKGRAASLVPQNEASTRDNEAKDKARRLTVGSRSQAASNMRSRSKSRDGLRQDRAEQSGGSYESPRVSVYENVGDVEHRPKGQTATGRLAPEEILLPRSQTNSLSPEYHSAIQNGLTTGISRSTTGSQTLVSDASTSTDTIRPANPRRRFSNMVRLQAPGDAIPYHIREGRGSETRSRKDERVTSRRKTNPSNATRKFVWIHVPFNNPLWVRKVFDTLSVKEGKDYMELFNTEHWASRHARGRHSQHHACFLKPACGYTQIKAKQYPVLPSGRAGPTFTRSDSLTPKQGCLYLYFPFLHFDSYRTLIKRRDMIKKRMDQGRTRPVPLDVAKDKSRELQVIWEYLGHDPPINCRRTLDQYRYPSLRDTRTRDDDQMLYKMTKENLLINNNAYEDSLGAVPRGDGKVYTQIYDETSGDENADDGHESVLEADSDAEGSDEDTSPVHDIHDILDGNVLMVDQLWLWVTDTSESNPPPPKNNAFRLG